LTREATAEELGATPASGLSGPEVEQRTEKYGPNVMSETKEESLWLQFLKQYKDYMRIVLAIAAIANFIVGYYYTGVILLIITAGNAYMALNQERKAGKSVDALNSMITGDHAVTAAAITGELGIDGRAITGA